MAKYITVVLCALVLPVCYSAKILAIFPMAIPSHYILGNALLRGLAEAGHDVTMISPFSEKKPPKKGSWRDVVLTGFIEKHEERMSAVTKYLSDSVPPVASAIAMPLLSVSLTEDILTHKNVRQLIESGEKFDVVIFGQFLDDAVKAFSNLFNAHLVVFSSISTNTMINEFVGNPSLPSFAPEFFSNYPPKMSFLERVTNTLNKVAFTLALHLYSYPKHAALAQKYISESIDFNQILYNTSLVLLNSHPSISTPLPRVPCMVEIGGFHIKPPKKLPEDLQSFLDNSTEGVIYMSMGSHMKSKDLPVEKREALLKTFSNLKQKVLWKWEDDVLPGQPPNVKLGKWLPQQDILAHPNVKVFITHGGLLSTTETVYHGVPIVAIPLMGDQKMNAYGAEVAGYAKIVHLSELTESKMSSTLNEVLSNPKYRNEVQRRSQIMRDRQVHPLDEAIYWVEYVIRHNGAKHLRVAYLDLAWYQYYLLDVIAFILAVIVVTYLLLRTVLRYVLRKCRSRKVKSD
uniref:UDP-glucuronosyltransferase n=1 Tax=Xylotrechus quadripes TaxID=554073 RepID=A0A6G7SFK0_9CUCU|nr:UDP-glycosyltransferase [Xylotrechus quadripes]